jgi:hypothetical protein
MGAVVGGLVALAAGACGLYERIGAGVECVLEWGEGLPEEWSAGAFRVEIVVSGTAHI